jgi:hypothetical protein
VVHDDIPAELRQAIIEGEASEERLKALAARLPGGESKNYIPVLCDFLASEYHWSLAVIAGLDNRQMIMFIEQALQRREEVRKPDEPHPASASPKDGATHTDDFRSVNWYGTEYVFTPTQAACVRVLWEAWERGTPAVGQDAILEAAGSVGGSLRHVFRKGKHPAWGKMIVSPGKGTFRLAKST